MGPGPYGPWPDKKEPEPKQKRPTNTELIEQARVFLDSMPDCLKGTILPPIQFDTRQAGEELLDDEWT